uniref:Uncharacterized protein n=1 Tax=Aegilops tauschii TaxID=37682 RepID=M8BLT6_AEGTA
MAKKNSSATSVRLMLILLVLLVFVGGILAQRGPSTCSNHIIITICGVHLSFFSAFSFTS